MKSQHNIMPIKELGSSQIDFNDSSNLENFPELIRSINEHESLIDWIQQNREMFKQKLSHQGAVLFRNFNIDNVEKFEKLMTVIIDKPLPYQFRSSPRYSVGNNIYISTTYPKDQMINMHSENSYARFHPKNIVFCCVTPASQQGETPIADNRKVLDYLNEEIKSKFLKHGVKYVQTIDKWCGLPWQEVFQTSEKTVVEEECRKNEVEYKWLGEDKLVLTWHKDAIWEHPETGKSAWFNHAFFFNKYALAPELLQYFEMNDFLPYNTFYGDGSEITKEDIEHLRDAFSKATRKFQWKKGDVLFLDNLLCSHGRNPYEGDRKIIVSVY